MQDFMQNIGNGKCFLSWVTLIIIKKQTMHSDLIIRNELFHYLILSTYRCNCIIIFLYFYIK